jgi:hypothetical protein
VVCDKCGAEASALKTCRSRDGDGQEVLCGLCWLPLRDRVWVVPGPSAVWGRCGSWESVRDLCDRKPGGGHGAMIGTCPGRV